MSLIPDLYMKGCTAEEGSRCLIVLVWERELNPSGRDRPRPSLRHKAARRLTGPGPRTPREATIETLGRIFHATDAGNEKKEYDCNNCSMKPSFFVIKWFWTSSYLPLSHKLWTMLPQRDSSTFQAPWLHPSFF